MATKKDYYQALYGVLKIMIGVGIGYTSIHGINAFIQAIQMWPVIIFILICAPFLYFCLLAVIVD